VNEDFELLLKLVQRHPPEVAGRAAVSPPTRQKLARFAAGQCAEAEREEVKHLLETHPELAAVLAEEVQSLRKPEP
jgi:2-oxo-4-hydroxy-4-carboxy--5-ureidoimidazoline (OHCU) decarboxylase